MHLMENHEQYARCLVLAGGGFRFGYYLGVHAAAEDCGRAPDVVLATCSGAIAAAIIAGAPDARTRLAWAASPAMYGFLREVASTPRATPLRTLGGAARRWMQRAPAQHVPDLFRDYLFELPDRLPLPLKPVAGAPALAIVGGQLLFGPGDAGTARGDRPLFAQTVFCPPPAAALLDGRPAPAADPRWSAGAVAPQLRADSATPLHDAVRISIADMFYFRSHACHGRHYTGGVIDLFPLEIAHYLAREVIMERKMPFNPWLAAPALRAVLGIDGAARLRHVHALHADAWVDTRDMAQALRAHGIGKRIDWRRNRIALAAPPSAAAYAAQVQAQWDYGYRKGMAAMKKATA